MASAKKAQVEAIADEIGSNFTHLAQLYQWAEEYVKAQDFILGRVDRKSSLAAAAHSHQIGRLASVLAANGGWGKKFSKLLGHMAYSEVHPEILQEVQKAKPSQSNGRPKKTAIYSGLFLRRTPIARNPDSYDANDLCIISGGGDAGVLKKFEQLYTPEDFQEKLDELQKAVTEGNPAWGGANTALDRSPEAQTIIEKLGFGFGSVDDGHVHDLAGSTANLHVVKTYSKRWGASEVIWQGLPALWSTHCDDMWLLALNMDALSQDVVWNPPGPFLCHTCPYMFVYVSTSCIIAWCPAVSLVGSCVIVCVSSVIVLPFVTASPGKGNNSCPTVRQGTSGYISLNRKHLVVRPTPRTGLFSRLLLLLLLLLLMFF